MRIASTATGTEQKPDPFYPSLQHCHQRVDQSLPFGCSTLAATSNFEFWGGLIRATGRRGSWHPVALSQTEHTALNIWRGMLCYEIILKKLTKFQMFYQPIRNRFI